jgi:NnrS protein
MTRTMTQICREPFRIFFPAGALLGVVGVSLWVQYYLGAAVSYPKVAHARLMIEGLMACFIFEFLGTAGRRLKSAPHFSVAEVASLFTLDLSRRAPEHVALSEERDGPRISVGRCANVAAQPAAAETASREGGLRMDLQGTLRMRDRARIAARLEKLSWFYFESPKETLENLLDIAGWMAVCGPCRIQVNFFGEVMS